MSKGRRDVALFAGALIVRLLHVAAIRHGPLLRYLLIDSAFYDSFAQRLAYGGGFPSGVFFMNPLYGTFLGLVYALFRVPEVGRLAALVLQGALGAGAVVLLARLGDALGRGRDGLIAAMILAVYGPAVFYDGALLTPSLMLFLTTLAILLLTQARHGGLGSAALLGTTTGLLILGRASNVLLIPAFAIVLPRHERTLWRSTALFTLCVVATIIPATIRNRLVSGEWVLVTANGGMALWAGNHPSATGAYSNPEFLSNAVPEREAEDYRKEAARRANRELTLPQSSSYWRNETWRQWARDPGWTARLFARKLRLWLSATESQTNLSYYFARTHSAVLGVLFLDLGWILPFALMGLRELRALRLPAIPVAVSLLTCLIFYVSSEYRHPVVPCLLLFAAAGLRRTVDGLAHASVPRRCWTVALLVMSLVLVNFRDPFVRRLRSQRLDNYDFGVLAHEAGNDDEAEGFLRRSIAIDPERAISRQKLAEVLASRGRGREAAAELGRAQALAHVEPSESRQALAEADRVFQGGDFAAARTMYLNLASRDEHSAATALNNAGLCSVRLGDIARAQSEFQSALERDPHYASPLIHLGRLALDQGDVATAEQRALQALEVAPSDERARRLLARARGSEP